MRNIVKYSRRNRITAFFVVFIALLSCEPFEPTPERPFGDWQILTITDEANSRYVEYAVSQASLTTVGKIDRLTAKIINENLFRGKDTVRGIGGRVSKVVRFFDNIYVFLPEQRKIEVLSETTYRSVATLDFTVQNRIPLDIVFINATGGYIIFENASVLTEYDVLSRKTTIDIEVGRNPSALAVRTDERQGISEVYCALRGDNQVVVIKTNGANPSTGAHNEIVARIPVPTAPQYIQVTPDKENLIVVSAGGGRFDNTPRTALRASRIDLRRRVLTQQAPVVNTADSTTETAYGMVLTTQDKIYIPTRNALYELSIAQLFENQIALDGAFRGVHYSPVRGEVLVAEVDSASMAVSCIIVSQARGKNSTLVPLIDLKARPKLLFTK
jgi:DNA-binding beta-propeller fold protein YncE